MHSLLFDCFHLVFICFLYLFFSKNRWLNSETTFSVLKKNAFRLVKSKLPKYLLNFNFQNIKYWNFIVLGQLKFKQNTILNYSNYIHIPYLKGT